MEIDSSDGGRCARTFVSIFRIQGKYMVMGSRHYYAYSTRHAILPLGIVCKLCLAGILHIGRTIRSGRMAQKIIIEESRPPLGGYQHNPSKDMACNRGIICYSTRCNIHLTNKMYRQHRTILGFNDDGSVYSCLLDAIAQVY